MLAALLRRLVLRKPAPGESIADALQAFECGDSDGADALCRRLIAASPDNADAFALRALVAERRGEHAGALALVQTALQLNEDEAAFQLIRARLLQALDRAPESIAPLERALALSPTGSPHRLAALLGLASAKKTSDPAAAERHLREVLARDPDHDTALELLATQLHHDSRTDDARALQLRRCRLQPGIGPRLRHALTIPVIYDNTEEIAAVRARLADELEQLAAERLPPVKRPDIEIGMTAFYLAYHGLNNRALLSRLGEVVRAACPAGTDVRAAPAAGRRPRVGFVSTYFHAHSVGRTTYGLIRDLPREDFETWVFAIAPHNDGVAAAIREAAERYVDLRADPEQVRTAIAEAGMDVLIYADIGMHPLTYFLAFWRLAPIQMTTWGHSDTSGIATLDYYLSAAQIEIPQAQDHYSETLVRLPGYFMPRYARVARPAEPCDRDALGLARGAHLFVCAQNAFKIHPDFDMALRGILERDPLAVIVLLDSNPHWTMLLRRRFARTLGPHAQRIHMVRQMPHAQFLQLLAGADALLDPFHFGGCNSSAEAMALGVPLVTLPSDYLHGRFSLGLYAQMQLTDCIATTAEDYIDIAVRLGTERDFNAAMRQAIARRAARLFERPDAGQALAAQLSALLDARKGSRAV